MTDETGLTLRDGEVILYQRENSKRWQARYKLPDGKWVRVSTKKNNLADAKKVATEAHDKARFLVQQGLNATSRRFRDVARITVSELQAAIDAGKSKTTFRDYIQAVNNYLVPFFGNLNVDKITAQTLTDFNAWRITKMGKNPAGSTLLNHSGALNRVFETAVVKGWITKASIPKSTTSGAASERRPAFTADEWKKIVSGLKRWNKETNVKRSQNIRELLYFYVMVLGSSGIRPGTEADNLKWKHIKWHGNDPKDRHLIFSLDGKVGKRQAAAGDASAVALSRIQAWFPELAKYSFDDLLDKDVDEYVFRMRDGKRTENLYAIWHDFLKSQNLLNDPFGQPRTLYSVRHTYATSRLLAGSVTIHELAEQMGTSVAMIEKHYSHLTPILTAPKFKGQSLSDDQLARLASPTI